MDGRKIQSICLLLLFKISVLFMDMYVSGWVPRPMSLQRPVEGKGAPGAGDTGITESWTPVLKVEPQVIFTTEPSPQPYYLLIVALLKKGIFFTE